MVMNGEERIAYPILAVIYRETKQGNELVQARVKAYFEGSKPKDLTPVESESVNRPYGIYELRKPQLGVYKLNAIIRGKEYTLAKLDTRKPNAPIVFNYGKQDLSVEQCSCT